MNMRLSGIFLTIQSCWRWSDEKKSALNANIIKTTINQQNVIAKKVIVLWIRETGDEINERTREDLGRDKRS